MLTKEERLEKLKEGEVIPGYFDSIFKELMLSKETRAFACHVISIATKTNYDYIYNNFKSARNELGKKKYIEKGKTVDVIVNAGNHVINVEMNSYYYDGLFNRNEVYLHNIIADNTSYLKDYKKLDKFYQINIDNFIKYKQEISHFELLEKTTGEYCGSCFEQIHVSLEMIKTDVII